MFVENVPNEDVKNVCTRCHSYARIAGERRTREEWFKLKDFHLATFPEELNSPDWPPSADKALNYLAQRFPLHTPEWEREKGQQPLGQGSLAVWGHEPRPRGLRWQAEHSAGQGRYLSERHHPGVRRRRERGAKGRRSLLRRLRVAWQRTVERRQNDS